MIMKRRIWCLYRRFWIKTFKIINILMKTTQGKIKTIALVIALVPLLIIYVLLAPYVKDLSPKSTEENQSEWGIVLTSIKSGDAVNFPIVVEGYLEGKVPGNRWYAHEGEIGSMVLINDKDEKLSNRVIIRTTSDPMVFPTYFVGTLNESDLLKPLETKSAILKISSNEQDDRAVVKILKVPVVFYGELDGQIVP